MATNIYTFVDYTGFLSEVFESDLNFAGDWRSTANYYRYDVVTHGFARYVCTVANSNVTPPLDTQFNSSWSIITFTSTGTGSSGTDAGGGASVQMVQDVYSLAYRAYSVALTGTDLPTPGAGSVPAWVMEWVGHTYNIAVSGTDAANSADMWGRTAYHIAVNGTNAADSAWSYAGQAWTIAVAGTEAADQAYSLATLALNTAWAGTDAGTGTGLPDGGSIGQVLKKNSSTDGDANWYEIITAGTTAVTSGTITLDFLSAQLQTVELTGNPVFVTTNRSLAKYLSLKIDANGTNRTLAFHGDWKWIGNDYTTGASLLDSKIAVLSLTCFGTDESDVVSVYLDQI